MLRIPYHNLRIRWNAARAALYRPPIQRSAARYQQPRSGWSAVIYATVRWSGDWFTGRRFLWLIGIAVAGSIIWLAGSHLGPGLRAAHGQGTDGLWTAQEQDAGQWYGEFVSSSGTVTLPYVYYAGGLAAVHAGTTVPALDTGAGDEVYPLAGSGKWIHDVIGIAVGALALIALLARGLFVARRRRRATKANWFSYSQLGFPYLARPYARTAARPSWPTQARQVRRRPAGCRLSRRSIRCPGGNSTRCPTLRFLAGSTINRREKGARVTSGQDRVRRGRRRLLRVVAVIAVLTLVGCGTAGSGAAVAPSPMSVSSEAFIQGALTSRYTCHGNKINPPLNWSGAPQGTKSLALIVDDSSAPITPFIYWLVFDIGPGTTDIQEGSLPPGARQAQNSAGTATYDAPCPKGHAHAYRFTVYALRTVLNQANDAPLQSVVNAIAAATIGRGRIVVTGNP